MGRPKFQHVVSWCLLKDPIVIDQQLHMSHCLLARSPMLTLTTLPEHWGLIMWASQAFASADSPAALLIRLELLWGSLRTCSAHLKGDRIGLHCHGNSIPFSPGRATHRPEPNESLFSATPPTPPHRLLHSCYSTWTTERLRADQLLILFSPYPQLGWLWASVCCERADMTVGGGPEVQRQQGKQNTQLVTRNTRCIFHLETWRDPSAGGDLEAVMNIRSGRDSKQDSDTENLLIPCLCFARKLSCEFRWTKNRMTHVLIVIKILKMTPIGVKGK